MYVVSEFGITRNGKDLEDRAWDDYSEKDEQGFGTLEEAMKAYQSIDLEDTWETELASRGSYQLMKKQVYAKELYIFNAETEEYGDTLEYDEDTYADHEKKGA